MKNFKIKYSNNRQEKQNDKAKAVTGASLGSIAVLFLMMKRQNTKNILNLEYYPKDMITLSTASITGSILLSSINKDKTTIGNKVKEGVFQFLNVSIPVLLTNFTINFCNSTKKLNNPASKLLMTTLSIITGMLGASFLANIITDPKDKKPDRKLTIKDSITNADDVIGALSLMKIPISKKPAAKIILPAIYTLCGYKAGKSN